MFFPPDVDVSVIKAKERGYDKSPCLQWWDEVYPGLMAVGA